MKTPGLPSPYSSLRRTTRRGFTLIELLLVLVILGILAGIVLPRYAEHTRRAKITATQSQIAVFKAALNTFEIDNGFYPPGRDGLQALVVAPRDASGWKGPYMESIPLDQWEHPYVYECPGKHNPLWYDVVSAGPDGKLGSEDDIGNWPTNRVPH